MPRAFSFWLPCTAYYGPFFEGNVIRKTAPPCAPSSRFIVPPCSLTIFCVTARPRPVPPEPFVDGPGKVGHYEILGELGRGGMGVVYRARDIYLKRYAALKCPVPEYAHDKRHRRQFLREAQAASALSHPNIVAIFEGFEFEGLPWIAMALVEGQSLRALLDKKGALPLEDTLRFGEGLASALQAAHARHVLHRDVNPNNILISKDDRALLTDFGLARFFVPAGEESQATTRSGGETREGRAVGTPGYMSPEQALAKPLDQRTDLFSLGTVLYEMCTGVPAFRSTDKGNVVDTILPYGRFLQTDRWFS